MTVRSLLNSGAVLTNDLPRIRALLFALGFCGSSLAYADFDPTVGRVVLSDTAHHLSLDAPNNLGSFTGLNFFSLELFPVSAQSSDFHSIASEALEGGGALILGGNVGGFSVELDQIAPRLRERRIEIKLWYLPRGTIPVLDLLYDGQALPPDPGALFGAVGSVRFFPTGRATDDGWVEISSGPIDFNGPEAFSARAIRALDIRTLESLAFGQASSRNAEVLLDGLGIYDLGPRVVNGAACSLVNEAAVCSATGACLYGRCVDARAIMGNLPASGIVREQYLRHLGARMAVLAGGRFPLQRVADFQTALSAVNAEPSVAVAWSGFERAFDELADGHISPPLLGFGFPIFGGACLYQSEADMLPGASVLPMVFETLQGHPVGNQLQPGDVLALIDGLLPQQWAERADRYISYGGDPRGRSFVTTPQILDAAIRTGATVEFHRCNLPPGQVCTEGGGIQRITIDLTPIGSGFLSGQLPNWVGLELACDFRFNRDVSSPNVRDGEFVGHADNNGVRTILINGVDGFGRWLSGAVNAMQGLPDRVILDERTGFGGTFEGVSAILEPFLLPSEDPIAMLVPQLTPEITPLSREQLMSCQGAGVFFCGNFFALQMTTQATPRGLQPSARIAILNGLDVSGNDYLPYALIHRAQGETRVFGAVPTYGAFGPIYTIPRVFGELIGGSVQLHDTIFLQGIADPSLEFHTGIGVEPDEIVLQRQSDAIVGVDTLLEAARSWVMAP